MLQPGPERVQGGGHVDVISHLSSRSRRRQDRTDRVCVHVYDFVAPAATDTFRFQGHDIPLRHILGIDDYPFAILEVPAVLVHVIRHAGAAPEVRIEMESDDLEKWDTIRHGRDISDVLRPPAQ